MQKLLIEDDEGKSVAVPLIRDEITIGRQDGNTIRLSEQNVSRRHARLVRHQGALMLEDLASYNGIKLNGAVLTAPASLKDGDIFLIGDYRMAIKEDRTILGMPGPAVGAKPAAAAEVRDDLDAQPTVPLTVPSAPVAQAAPAAVPARLVVVGKFMAGREFVLDRASLVIGRTAENDIVIEHKSISRHHARIVQEDGQYFALDLESANGVRVNGSDHNRVQLRAGDEIELGQVLLRFVTDDSSAESEAALADQKKRKVLMIAGGGAAALVLVLVFALSGGKSQPKPLPPPPVAATPAPAPVPPPPPKEPLPELLAAAKAAQENENWDEVLKVTSKAVEAYPEATEAAELRKLAEGEKSNAERFASVKQAAESGDFPSVTRGAAEITEGSLYKERATALEKSTRAEYIKQHFDTAFAKAKTGECDTATQEAELVLAVDTGNKAARSIVSRCAILARKLAAQGEAMKKPAAAAPKPAPAPKPVALSKPKQPAAAPMAAPADAVDPEKLIQQARDAWLRGQYAVAIDAARRALRAKPGLSSAYQIIAICSCSLHDPDTAFRAYEKLDERNKQLVRSACQKNGISF
jgi:pSer/pThr/pTyr-binding forkhead associated (FHA) protein